MASKRLKGITIEIDGNTTKLSDALGKLNAPINKVNDELKELKNALKLDPKNTELLAQKQEVLKKNIQESTNKLNELKRAQQQMGNYNNLTEQQKEAYRALSVEISKSQSAIKNLKDEYKDFGSVAKQQLEEVGKKLEDTGKKIEGAGKGLTKSVTVPITGLITAGTVYNAEIEKYQTALTTLTGSSEKANEIIEQIKKDASATPFDVSGLVRANQLLISTGINSDEARDTILALGNAVSATGGGSEELSRMAQNLQQIKNAGEATAMDMRQFAYAGIDLTGLLSDYLGKTADQLTANDRSFENISEALKKASSEGGKYFGAMEKQSETFNGKMSNLKDTFDQFTGNLAETLAPVLEKIMGFITNLMNKFNELDPGLQNIISTILIITATVGPILIFLGKIVSSIGTIMPLLTKLVPIIKGVWTAITGPVGLVVLAVTSIIAIIVTLYNKCEWFRDGVNAIANKIKEGFLKFVDWIKEKVEKIKEGFTSMINWIKTIPDKIKEIPTKIVNLFSNIIGKIKDIGTNIVKGIWDGISGSFTWIKNKIKGWVGDVMDFIKGLFGIHSPSTVMRDQIGINLTKGIGKGFEKGMPGLLDDVNSAMSDLNSEVKASVNPTINPTANTNPLILNIENFNNSRNTDIQQLAEELEFYRKNSALAKGGN